MKNTLNKFTHLLDPGDSKKKYFFVYTVLFAVLSLIVFSWHILSKRSLIWYADGWTQHYPALIYYGRFLRSIAKSVILEHKFAIPDFDFAIGEGSDIMNTLHYYAIGEPINLLSALVPTRFMHLFYSGMIVFRIYLSGLTFSALCFFTGIKKPVSILAGAFSYAFCGWTMLYLIRHPYFITPLIILPLMIFGAEMIFSGKKPYLFIAAIVLSAVSNFYFFYMSALTVVVYCIVRSIDIYKKDFRKIIAAILKIAVPAVIGALIAGIILVPIVKTFLTDSRMATEHKWYLFYPLSYYAKLPSIFISNKNSFYLYISLTAPVILSAFLLFRKKKENTLLKALFFICLAIILVPFFGQIFNGLSYRSNRWCFSLPLLCCYIFVKKWDSLIKLTKKDGKYLLLCVLIIFALCLISSEAVSPQTYSGICFLFAFIVIMLLDWGNGKTKSIKEIVSLLLVIANIGVNAYWSYSSNGNYLSAEDMEISAVKDEFLMNDSTAVLSMADDGFIRYSGRGLEVNRSILNDISSDFCFWSNSNPNIASYRSYLSINDKFVNQFKGNDDRSYLLALSSMNYFVNNCHDGLLPPYGFVKIDDMNVQSKRTKKYREALKKELGVDELTEEQIKKIRKASNDSFDVYKNENPMPIGYCYNKYISQNTWENMTSLQRQEAMLSAVYIEDNSNTKIKELQSQSEIKDIEYSFECEDSEITFIDGNIVTTSPDKKLTLTFDGIENSETYLQFSNLHFDATSEYDLYFGSKSVDPLNLYNKANWDLLEAEKRQEYRRNHLYFENPATAKIEVQSSLCEGTKFFHHRTDDDIYAFGKTNYVVNLGYSEEAATKIEIKFPTAGVYSLDSLKVSCLPMASFNEKVNALKADSLQNVEFGTNKVTGSLTASQNEVLCVAIPYSDGWTAFVDGEETEIFHANEQYIGLNVSKGEHKIELRYSRPWKNIGYASTALGVVILAAYIVIERIKSSKAKANTK